MRDHLATLLDDFRRHGRDVAVVRYQGVRRRVTTYGELARLAGRFAALLEQRGIVSGDRVLLWGDNSAEWIAAFHGCMMRGVLAVPLDASGTADFAARVAADVKPKLAVGDALLLDHLAAPSLHWPGKHPGHNGAQKNPQPDSEVREQNSISEPQLDFPRLAFESWPSELPPTEAGPIPGLSHETPLQILFTSGTTGDPKGIVITHGNVLSSIGPVEDGSQPYLRYEWLVHPLRILHTLPLSHVFGQTMGLWIPPIYTAELHFESRLAAPRLIHLIRDERISVLATVPRVLTLLKTHLEMNHPGLADRIAAARKTNPWLRWWRYRKVHRGFGLKFWAFVSGGGALPGPLEQFWNALGFVLIQGYGMTETTALITLNHPFHVAKGTIGKPLAGREVKLAPDGEVLVRGQMISGATWSGGKMRPRSEDWLATGDLAERAPSGELKFLGRKSEVIVTAAGLNLHPEDIEAVIEEQPGVAACAVVPIETAAGIEPCAVLATRGSGVQAATAIEHANAQLAEFQRIGRWFLWPEPDLPRTSTGKVRRKAVAQWLARTHAAGGIAGGNGKIPAPDISAASSDWLLSLIAQITGETPSGADGQLRLTEDLHLDSLGRVQLAAAIEERLGIVSGSGLLEEVQTLGDLRKLVAGESAAETPAPAAPAQPVGVPPEASRSREIQTQTSPADAPPTKTPPAAEAPSGLAPAMSPSVAQATLRPPSFVEPQRSHFVYPTWPWFKPVEWLRIAFIEIVMRPLVWFLGAPRVATAERRDSAQPGNPAKRGQTAEPILIVANHITAYDAPLIQYALPGPLRRHMAIAMAGQMLEDFRHARNPTAPPGKKGFFLFGPPAYFLVTALFNVFPLPRQRDFQISFAHAGRALDHGYNVLIFPEGARSAQGKLAPFRPGIGLLTRQSYAPVLPVALRGLGGLKASGRGWFRSGDLEICVGQLLRFAPEVGEAVITARLQDEVERLMKG